MSWRLDREDGDENFLGYIFLKDHSVSHDNKDEVI